MYLTLIFWESCICNRRVPLGTKTRKRPRLKTKKGLTLKQIWTSTSLFVMKPERCPELKDIS